MRKSRLRAIALLAAVVPFLVAGPPCSFAARAQPTFQELRDDFTRSLHDHARGRAAVGTPEYFAIVRRGMNQFDAFAEKLGMQRAKAAVKFDQLDATPEALDNEPVGQLSTKIRLGIQIDNDTRVVGGWKLKAGEFDEAVAITGGDQLCTGVALDAKTVLTAAHCICDLRLATSDDDDRFKRVFVSTSIHVVGASKHRVDIAKTRFISRHLSNTEPCGSFAASLQAGNPDLAVVRVHDDEPMTVPAVKIATPSELAAAIGTPQKIGEPVYVVGFGCTDPIQPGGPFLGCFEGKSGDKEAGVVFHSGHCTTGGTCVPGAKEFVLRDLAGSKPVDTCGGDSGGPAVIINRDGASLRSRLVGITSRALNNNGNCGEGGIYTKVATDEVLGWLKNVVGVDVQH